MSTRKFELLYPAELGDGRNVTGEMIQEIAASHKEASRYPVAKGHMSAIGVWDDATPAAGHVTNLSVDPGNVLVGDVHLTDEVEAEYNKGLWPGWSAGISRPIKGNGPDAEYGAWVFGHLALLGSVAPAFDDLRDMSEQRGFSKSGDCAYLRTDTSEYVLFRAREKTEPTQPANSVRTPDPGGRGEGADKPNQESEKMELEKLTKENEQFRAERDALKEQVGLLMQEKNDATKAQFAREIGTVAAKLQELGVSEQAREAFSKATHSLENAVVGGSVDCADLFSSIVGMLSEVRPKVEPGDATPKGDGDTEGFSASREATQALYGKLEG